MNNNDEFGADSWYGKRAGETYKEADQRKAEEHRQTMEELYQRQRDENNKASVTGNSSGGGGGMGSLGLPGEKTALARFVSRVGFWGFGIGICLWFFQQSYPQSISEKLPIILIGTSIACLVLIYLFQVVTYVLIAFAVLFIWYEGSTNFNGFHFSAVPIRIYLISGGVLLLVYILKKALSQD